LADFKVASFMQGKLVRITKKNIELQVIDEESNEPAVATVKLGLGVSVSLDALGEDVKVVIVDGKVARITPVSLNSSPGVARVGS
jgi:hypothetical protein